MKSRTLAFVLIGVGALFLTYGLMRGEAQVVFSKAVHICLECIGIG